MFAGLLSRVTIVEESDSKTGDKHVTLLSTCRILTLLIPRVHFLPPNGSVWVRSGHPVPSATLSLALPPSPVVFHSSVLYQIRHPSSSDRKAFPTKRSSPVLNALHAQPFTINNTTGLPAITTLSQSIWEGSSIAQDASHRRANKHSRTFTSVWPSS